MWSIHNHLQRWVDDDCRRTEDETPVDLERTKMSIANLDHSPLTQTSTFLGGMRSVSTVPNLNYTESGMNWSTPKTGMNDEDSRNAATMSTASMSISLTIAVLAMGWNHWRRNPGKRMSCRCVFELGWFLPLTFFPSVIYCFNRVKR